MGKTYLLSPVGNSDPIKYFHDGSMLHICRHYRPDVVCLYLSKEMIGFHEKDNRFLRSLELLGEKLNHPFEVRLIKREELVNVHRYDVFYYEFREEIFKIQEEMGVEDELLVNMSSGTPAMKSALFMLATLAEYKFKAIQVSSPKHESNLEHEERVEYDADTNWELNEDNNEGAENRCSEEKSLNLIKMLKIDMIKKHLLAYDYYAARSIAEEIAGDISEEALAYIQIASARYKLGDAGKLLKEYPFDIYPVKSGDKRMLFEYALSLQLKVKKEEYADFARAITPLNLDLCQAAMKSYCKIDIRDLTREERGVTKWDEGKVVKRKDIADILSDGRMNYRYGVVYSYSINKIIQAKCTEQKICQKINEIIEIEGKIRNQSAHEVVSVTDEWIYKKTGKHAKDIMDIIKYLCEILQVANKKSDWDSYDEMNKRIIEKLN